MPAIMRVRNREGRSAMGNAAARSGRGPAHFFLILSDGIRSPVGGLAESASHSASSGNTGLAFLRRWIWVSMRRLGFSLEGRSVSGVRLDSLTGESPESGAVRRHDASV